ncbi:AAA family ATPase [Saccharicrinis sp. FJH2]|uniref:AAA family ATPase n=1 Tax=Saccharicrinis sp. FJH65 TaxID=3344659 RepID=UPI0035F282A3
MAKYNIINENNKGLRTFPKILVKEYYLKRRISLKNNHIASLPNYFIKLKNLEYLNLSGNKFVSFPKVIGDLENLIEVDFNFNLINEINNIGLSTSIQKISMEGNSIDKFPNNIQELKNLRSINLSNNKLTEFPIELCKLNSITSIDLSDNNIGYLPSDIKNLTNLVSLNLNNTNLNKFTKELKELPNLQELHISGNNFKLPPNYNPLTPLNTIDFFLKQEEFAKLKTTKAYVFKNQSKKIIIDKYNSILEKFTEEKGIDIVFIEELEDISKDATIVFIIICFDIHDDPQLVGKVIDKCKKLDLNFFILMEEDIIGGRSFVNLSKGALVDAQHNELKKNFQIRYFKEYGELINIIFNAVNQRAPNIKLTNIELTNIGHFSNISIPISKNVCCIVGENGTGKSTILKAIALATIGNDFDSINKNEIYKLLRIKELDDNSNIKYYNGRIKLDYTIDGDSYINEISIINNNEDGSFSIMKRGDFEISTTGQNLKSLILGFPQIRGGFINKSNSLIKKLNQPHIDDILPLINDTESNRLSSYGNWIAQLFFDAVKKEYEKDLKVKEWQIIKKAFEVISSFSDYDIKFKTVESGESPVVWVITNGAPNGIPLDFVSQGFKVVMGWLGYFMQRLIESYPVQTPDQSTNSHAILIIDEIDTYIHPKWQTKLINILRKIFPNTQFLLSTHSPLAISSCEEGEVVLLEIKEDGISLKNIDNIKGWSVENILHDVMGVENTRDSEVAKKISEIEKLFIKKYKNTITKNEEKKMNELITDVDNLPPSDPVITLLNLKALKGDS